MRMSKAKQGWDGWYFKLPLDYRVWLRVLPSYGEQKYGERLKHDGRQIEIGWRRY